MRGYVIDMQRDMASKNTSNKHEKGTSNKLGKERCVI